MLGALLLTWAVRAQARGQQTRTAAELAEASKKAVLADKLQAQLREATDNLVQRDAELQDFHQDVEQAPPLWCCRRGCLPWVAPYLPTGVVPHDHIAHSQMRLACACAPAAHAACRRARAQSGASLATCMQLCACAQMLQADEDAQARLESALQELAQAQRVAHQQRLDLDNAASVVQARCSLLVQPGPASGAGRGRSTADGAQHPCRDSPVSCRAHSVCLAHHAQTACSGPSSHPGTGICVVLTRKIRGLATHPVSCCVPRSHCGADAPGQGTCKALP